MTEKNLTGDFTLPGESGAEKLTLDLAKKWGADTIRDSDGTELSAEILNAGYNIYSTICIIRCVNEWAKKHPNMLQQTFLMSNPVTATENSAVINLLNGFSKQQFKVNFDDDPKKYWQVFDRTENKEIPYSDWDYSKRNGTVTVNQTKPYHIYTVNFLSYRIWEEISMYNHITNNWGDKEHLMAVEPRFPEVRECLLDWLEDWCKSHPDTNVVRFTSLFYNFVWIWGENDTLRDRFVDWASYDFSVNSKALDDFEKEYGYKMYSEDFINSNKYNSTHNPPSKKYLDWIDFTSKFVAEFGKKCVDTVHRYGKKAFVFYDDSWVGVEPYGKYFETIGFDGIIKCVFNAFEERLCADVKSVKTHEIRLHPYLFPTGLGGLPTFSDGGNPKLDAGMYWSNVRRGLLRKCVDRIGLGGYLTLTLPFPEFNDYIEELADEFRKIKQIQSDEAPLSYPISVAIITSWGKIRSWSCSGHKHEHPDIDLINVIEALAGLPVSVSFLGLEDIAKKGIPDDINVLINAGIQNSAWSGGYYWSNSDTVSNIRKFVDNGGAFIGINEPSAYDGGISSLQLSDILGVDIENGNRICIGKYTVEAKTHYITDGITDVCLPENKKSFVCSDKTIVLSESNGAPSVAVNTYGNGRSVYLSGFNYTAANARLLMRALIWSTGNESFELNLLCSNENIDIAVFKNKKIAIASNSSNEFQVGTVFDLNSNKIEITLNPYETKFINF